MVYGIVFVCMHDTIVASVSSSTLTRVSEIHYASSSSSLDSFMLIFRLNCSTWSLLVFN